MRNRKLLTRRAASARLTTVAAGTPAGAILVEGVAGQEVEAAIPVAEVAGREAEGWAVEVWAAGEDSRPIAEAV